MLDTEEARKLRESGLGWSQVADALDTSAHMVRAAIDPGYMDRRRRNLSKVRQAQDAWIGKEAAKNRKAAGITYAKAETNRRAEQDWRDRLAEIGPDDRDMTGRMMGDPPSWRSALGRPAR